MKLKILGSGGSHPTPKPLCKCSMCEEARKKGMPYSRGGCSLFIEKENVLIDTPMDIANLLNRNNIFKINSVLYTHHHPDHVLGAKLFEMMNYDYVSSKTISSTKTYFPPKVLENSRKIIDEFDFAAKRGIITINEISAKKKIGNVLFTPFITDSDQNVYGFIIEQGKKKIIYAPCDNHDFPEEVIGADLAIVYCGYLNKRTQGPEELLENIIAKVKRLNVKRIIITHIEEIRKISYSRAKILGKKLGVEFAYDGMVIDL